MEISDRNTHQSSGIPAFDRTKALLFLVLFIPFAIWRITGSGTLGATNILSQLEERLILDQTSAVHQQTQSYPPQHGYSEDYWRRTNPANYQVEFSDVQTAASLFSWSALEKVVIRVDYQISVDGEPVAKAEDKYFLVTRGGATTFVEADVFTFYLHRLL